MSIELNLYRCQAGEAPPAITPVTLLGSSPPALGAWTWERQGTGAVSTIAGRNFFSWLHIRPDTNANSSAIYLADTIADTATPRFEACVACTYGSSTGFFGICLKGQNGGFLQFGFETLQNFANGWLTARYQSTTTAAPSLLLQQRVTGGFQAVWLAIDYVVATDVGELFISLDGTDWQKFGEVTQDLGTSVIKAGLVSTVGGIPGISANIFSFREA